MNILTVYMDDEDTERVIDGIAACGAHTLVVGMGSRSEAELAEAELAYRAEPPEGAPDWDELSGLTRGALAWQRQASRA